MSDKTHPVQQEEVMAFLDGELDPECALEVSAHLEQCAECSATASDFRNLSRQMLAWQVEPAPDAVKEKIAAAAHQKANREPRRNESARTRVPRRLWGFAAAAAILLIVGGLAFQRINSLLRPTARMQQSVDTALVRVSPYSARTVPKMYESEFGKGTIGKMEVGQFAKGPMVARTASLNIVVQDFAYARGAVERITSEQKGYVAELNVSSQQDTARVLTGTLEIPAAQLDAALVQLRGLGRVEQETQAAEDVTDSYSDLLARLSNSRQTEQRLLGILRERTGKLNDVLEVERENARVRGEIEEMEGEQKRMENRVALAAVKFQITEAYKAKLGGAPLLSLARLRNSLVAGLRAAVESAMAAILFVLDYGPTLLLWGLILFWPARFAWRRWAKAFASK